MLGTLLIAPRSRQDPYLLLVHAKIPTICLNYSPSYCIRQPKSVDDSQLEPVEAEKNPDAVARRVRRDVEVLRF
ncbi:hypothetical protein Aduo_001499 [Ancylostoma duodenale]